MGPLVVATALVLPGAVPAQTVEPVAPITQPGDYRFTFEHQGQTRRYRVHLPASYRPTQPTPVVISLHGGGGNMDLQADDRYYGQIAQSERSGVIAVFPNGFSRFPGGRLATWNAGRCCGAARDQDVDDVSFIRALLQRLRRQVNVDEARIFASGMSNGGMMAYRLACEMPETFRAVASVAGTDNTVSCTPARAVSVLHIHARDDERELFDGGAGKRSRAMTDFVSVPDSVATWVRHNACPAAPKRVFETAGAYCESYAPCRDATEVKLCVTETGGHSWPGGTKPRGGAAGSSALSATEVISEFFLSR